MYQTRMGERQNWRGSEMLKAGGMILAIGIAWGSLMFEVKSTHADVLSLDARTAQIEKFLITKSKGEFVPAIPDGAPKQ